MSARPCMGRKARDTAKPWKVCFSLEEHLGQDVLRQLLSRLSRQPQRQCLPGKAEGLRSLEALLRSFGGERCKKILPT